MHIRKSSSVPTGMASPHPSVEVAMETSSDCLRPVHRSFVCLYLRFSGAGAELPISPCLFASIGLITITNEGSKPITDYYWNIDWVKPPSISPKAAYFHAQYRQCAPCKGWYNGNIYGNDFSGAHKDPRWFNKTGENNYVVLDAKGEGQFVGMMLSVFNNQWGAWNEGDDMIWIDGEKEPQINGTGGEDYFNSAWVSRHSTQPPSSAWWSTHKRSPVAAPPCTAGISRPPSAFTNPSK